jgi:hypothetical protein
MRFYQKLDRVFRNETDDTLLIECSEGEYCLPKLWFGREGLYVSVSASYGPLEIALRPRQRALVSALGQLRPTEHLSVMRTVGTGQAHIELGLATSGELLLRTTIVADATGHVAMNMILSSEVRAQLFAWLGIENEGDS